MRRHLRRVGCDHRFAMIHSVRRGNGPPLLLVHGLGGSWRSWTTILDALTPHREVIAIDLPGHGRSPAEHDSGTFAGLVRSVEAFVKENDLRGIDIVGSSMGARIVLELARRGGVGDVVALDPGGFWRGWERTFFRTTIGASVRLLRAARSQLPALSGNPVTRTLLLAQLSAHPWRLDGDVVATELASYATTSTFDDLVNDLAAGPEQRGPAASSTGRISIAWGRHDRLCLPRQASRARVAFPSARLQWFEHSGHFPMWDEPEATARFVLRSTHH